MYGFASSDAALGSASTAIGSPPSSTPPLRPMVRRRFRPDSATSPGQQDLRSKRNRQGARKGVCGLDWAPIRIRPPIHIWPQPPTRIRPPINIWPPAAHPHSVAYPHLAPAAHPVFGRLSTSGLRPLIRAWRHHQGKKKGVSRISSAAHSHLAAGLQESPRTSPQFCRACLGRLGSDAHLRLAAGL